MLTPYSAPKTTNTNNLLFFSRYYLHFHRARCDVAARYGFSKDAPGWAVVTGGSSGIGFEIVALLLKAGFSVCCVALPQEERAFVRRLGAKGEHLGPK